MLSVPTTVAHDILRLQQYCQDEQIEYLDFFKRYLSLLRIRELNNKNFLSCKNSKKGAVGAYWLFTKYFNNLRDNNLKTFLPFWTKTKAGLPKVNEGEVLIYTLVVLNNTEVSKIKDTKSINFLLNKVIKTIRARDPVLFYYIKFQSYSSEHPDIFDGYSIANNSHDV